MKRSEKIINLIKSDVLIFNGGFVEIEVKQEDLDKMKVHKCNWRLWIKNINKFYRLSKKIALHKKTSNDFSYYSYFNMKLENQKFDAITKCYDISDLVNKNNFHIVKKIVEKGKNRFYINKYKNIYDSLINKPF